MNTDKTQATVDGVRVIEGVRALLAAPIAPRAKYDPATQPGSPEFDGAEAYQAHLEAMYPDEAAPRADADTAVDPQTKAQLESLARHSYGGRFAIYMSGDDARALLAAGASNERADAEPASDTEEADALRAFDKTKRDGHSYDLESYCAGHIDKSAERADAEKDAALTNAWAKLRAAMNAHPRAVMTLVEEAYVILDTALAAKEKKS